MTADSAVETIVSAIPLVLEWLDRIGYRIADDGVVVSRAWDAWYLTVHTTAVDSDSVVFEWSYDDVLQMLEDVPHHAK